MGVAIADDHAIIFIDKVRESGGDGIDAVTHLLDGNRFGLEGYGGCRNVMVVNGCDALSISQSDRP